MRTQCPTGRRRSLQAVLLALAVAAAAGCTGSTGEPDATATPSPPDARAAITAAVSPGDLPTAKADYRLDDLQIPGVRLPVEVEGHVVGPVGASGPLPLVVLLHGYTASCWRPADGSSTTDWPCRKGFRPIPSWRGFAYLQERLASQGYLTVSLSANGVNVMATEMGDDAGAAARAALVRRHLDAWAAGEVPGSDQWPDVDLDSVMLVGHSRGGEGVDRTVADRPASAAWTVRGEVLVAPTAFEPAKRSTVPVVTMTGSCDGDVGPGPGQRYVDRPAGSPLLRSAVLVDGANHNFFNAEWVPGDSTVPGGFDDAYGEEGKADPLCETGADTRLTADQQQDVALRILGLAAAAFLRDDTAAADVLDGRTPVPVAGDEVVRVAALGRGRTTVAYGAGYSGRDEGSMTVRTCDGVSETEDPGDCGAFTGEGASVHWPAAWRSLPVREYLELTWEEAGGSAVLDLTEPLDLSAATGVEARIAVAPEGPPVELDVVLTDGDGASVTVPGADAISALPQGPLLPSRRWGQRFFAPLDGVTGVDLTDIDTVAFVARSSSGHVWVIDVSAPPADPPGAG